MPNQIVHFVVISLLGIDEMSCDGIRSTVAHCLKIWHFSPILQSWTFYKKGEGLKFELNLNFRAIFYCCLQTESVNQKAREIQI